MDVPYSLTKYDPDALRFYLTATLPETRDAEFSWEDFVERNNHVQSRSPEPREGASEGNELVATHSLRSVQAWAKSALPPGQALRQPAPLFKKLDESVIEEDYARLGE